MTRQRAQELWDTYCGGMVTPAEAAQQVKDHGEDIQTYAGLYVAFSDLTSDLRVADAREVIDAMVYLMERSNGQS